MPTISDVVSFLEDFAPPRLAEDWDNTGLLIGRSSAAVQNIMTCLTLTTDVAAEAVEKNVQLVVSHHPVLFRGTKRVADDSQEGRLLLSLIENGVAVYSPHTSFDSASDGINQQLAKSFGLTDIAPIRPLPDDEELGGGRYGSLSLSMPLIEFLTTVSGLVNAKYLEYTATSNAEVRRVAVACGAAAEYLVDAVRLGCDTFVTGEARFHGALEARAAGVNLVLLGHYSSERPAVEQLADLLSAEFSNLDVWSSRVEVDPLTVFLP